jgi:hypothetical protein
MKGALDERLGGQWIPPSDGEHEIVCERVPDCLPIAVLERFIRSRKSASIRCMTSPPLSDNADLPCRTQVSTSDLHRLQKRADLDVEAIRCLHVGHVTRARYDHQPRPADACVHLLGHGQR